jgi:solute carrier family 25 (peroxisomal adenine nucleotide transporter), member 17
MQSSAIPRQPQHRILESPSTLVSTTTTTTSGSSSTSLYQPAAQLPSVQLFRLEESNSAWVISGSNVTVDGGSTDTYLTALAEPMEDATSMTSSEVVWIAADTGSGEPHALSSIPSETPVAVEKLTMLQCLRNILRKGELYRGAGPLTVTLATSSFVFFYMNEWCKRVLTRSVFQHHHHASSLSLVASCLAGMVNVLVTNPLWVANLRIVTGDSESTSLWSEMRAVARRQGMRELWRGTGSSILLVSNPVIQFYCYERLRDWQLQRSQSTANLRPMQAFWTGALAKTVATVLTYPVQLTQAVLRMQQSHNEEEDTDNDDEETCPTQRDRYRGILDCLIKIYQRDGIEGLFTGMRAKLLQTVLTAAFTFLTYEQILRAVHTAMISSQQQRRAPKLL